MDEENLSSVARAKPWRVITTKEEILARAITKQNEKERRDAVKAKIICVAQRDAVRDFLTQCTDLCNKREWTKLKTTSNPKR